MKVGVLFWVARTGQEYSQSSKAVSLSLVGISSETRVERGERDTGNRCLL